MFDIAGAILLRNWIWFQYHQSTYQVDVECYAVSRIVRGG